MPRGVPSNQLIFLSSDIIFTCLYNKYIIFYQSFFVKNQFRSITKRTHKGPLYMIFGQAVSRVLYQTIIYLDLLSPAGSSDPPTRAATGSRLLCPLLVLLRMGFTRPACYHTAGELLPHHFNLATAKLFRRYVSVALSLRLPSPDVIWHPRPVEPGLSSRLTACDCLPARIILNFFKRIYIYTAYDKIHFCKFI